MLGGIIATGNANQTTINNNFKVTRNASVKKTDTSVFHQRG